MARELLAVEGLTLQDTLGGAPSITINSTPSAKSKAGGSGIYYGGLTFTIASGSASATGCALSSPLQGTITPTGSKVKNGSGQLPSRLGDEVTVSGPGTSGGSGCTATFTIKITDAGQTKVKGA